MTMRRFSCAASAVKMAVAILPLAGCDTGGERWSARLGGLLDSGFSTGHTPAGDLIQADRDLSIEHRHYDIYTRYREAFENSNERFEAEQAKGEGGMQLTEFGRDGSYSTLPSCSVRMLMAQD